MLKESKSTCVVKVKLNVVDARFCDAWWLGRWRPWKCLSSCISSIWNWININVVCEVSRVSDERGIRKGTNIEVACIARCAWDLWTKHWLWSKHFPEQKKKHNLQDRCQCRNKNLTLSFVLIDKNESKSEAFIRCLVVNLLPISLIGQPWFWRHGETRGWRVQGADVLISMARQLLWVTFNSMF